jgi:hypothetical protein
MKKTIIYRDVAEQRNIGGKSLSAYLHNQSQIHAELLTRPKSKQ